MKIAHLNIRSIFTGFQEFREIVIDNDLDVMLLSETWLGPDHKSDMVSIPGYIFFRKDRAGRGGGVGAYVKASVSCEMLLIDIPLKSTVEFLLLKIKNRHQSCIVGVFYRPPNTVLGDVTYDMDHLLSLTCHTVDWMACLGDFNVNFFHLDNPLMHSFESFGFSQLMNVATRTTNTSSTLLDVIFVSETDLVNKFGALPVHGISDHDLTFVEINIPILHKEPKFVTYRCFRNFNIHNLLDDLYDLPWHYIITETDLDKKIELFNEFILTVFNKYAPIVQRRVTKQPAPWLTDNLKILQKERNKALQKFKKTRSEADFNNYKELRNYTLSVTRHEKKTYLNQAFQTKDSKTYWKILRNFSTCSNHKNLIPEHLSNPNALNNYFSTFLQNVSDICDDKINFYNGSVHDPSIKFSFKLITVEEVNKFLHNIRTNAFGVDNINARMLKYCSPFIDKYITHIINCCIEKSYFPVLWKNSLGIPIPKKSNPKDFSDIRVISLLPTISKIYEKFLYSQIYDYVTNNDLLSDCQCGFRPGRNTEISLATVTTDILTACDQGLSSALVLLDYSKAFDTINHELLCAKLKFYGFDEPALFLIWNYFLRRSQKILNNGAYSSSLDILSGVPQGSILGPLLFIVYTSDILKKIDYCKVQAFADDTQLYASFHTENLKVTENIINNELNEIKKLSDEHNLKLNSDKSKVMYFGNKKSKILLKNNMSLRIDNTTLQASDSARNLGLIIDTDIRFSKHVSHLVSKAFSFLKLIYNNRHILSIKMKRNLCESLVLSHFNYCDFIYGPCLSKEDRDRIQKVQNSCCRLIYGIRKYDHISHKLKECNWLNMENRRQLHLGSFTHKLLNNSLPPGLLHKFIPRSGIHAKNIRKKSTLTMPQHKTAMFQRSFIFNAIRMYNHLPDEFKLFNINKFKYKLKNYLFHAQ